MRGVTGPLLFLKSSIVSDSEIVSPRKEQKISYQSSLQHIKMKPRFLGYFRAQGDDDCFSALSDTFKLVIYAA